MDSAQAGRLWQRVFVLYGVLSLSFMAAMGIGSGLFLLATLVFFALGWKQGGAEKLRQAYCTPYTWISLAFFLACFASLIGAKLQPVEGGQEGPLFSSLKKFHYFLYPPLFALAFLGAESRMEKHSFWRAWGWMGAFLGLLAVVQFYGAVLFPEPWLHSEFFRPVGETPRFHGQGLMMFHLSFASCMCFVAAAAWARLIFPLAGDARRERLLWGGLVLISSLGVYFSYSRIALGALVALIALLGFLRRWRLGLGLLLALSLIGWGLWSFSPALRTRFIQNEGGNMERLIMWKSALLMFEQRPVFGVGFGRTGELSPHYAIPVAQALYHRDPWFTSHAHDNFLDILATTGLVGAFLFLAWWGFLFYSALRAFRRAPLEERWLPAAALAGFLAFHVNGLTQVNFWDGKSEHTLMLFAGLAVALWVRDEKKAKH
jgi:O-antigen ligase